MSLGKIDPRQRDVLRLHGWLLMAWACAVGLICSAVLLHVFRVQSMALRYAIGAGSVYFLGFVLGGWWYAKWWNAQRQQAAEMPQHASAKDQLAYQQEQEAIGKKFSAFEWVGDLGSGLGEDPLSAILAVFVLIGVVLVAVLLLGYLPLILTDVLAGYLAEIVLEFVIGAVLVRQVLRPRGLDGYWTFMLKKTWVWGLLMMVVFGGLGFAVQRTFPDALTLLQALR
jgi:hypothetical protein